ncbi:hypothetical protein ASZ90_019321 [hydrocarbon metagenome]|uniref:Antitoxin Xre/MbcA/ParS-like toxin-binding domain-containing protein n=1 Tax=hydrocarbon metagenome TaxID=938273 RepID=A0A0W8E4A5_9ZZZZ
MKKPKNSFPRPVLKSFVDDIKKLVGNNEGRMIILEMMEDIPYELRSDLIQNLSAFYDPDLVGFFYLLKLEYGREFELICSRILEKYSMAGIDIAPPQIFAGAFQGAYASMTRHSGRVAIDIAWSTGNKKVQAECFYLTYNPDGIHSFFLVEGMNEERYEADRKFLKDMIPLSFEEVCFLVSRAYDCNIRHMSKPAPGRFLYNKYLHPTAKFSNDWQRRLISKLSIRLTPRQIVNSLFHAVKNQDIDYVYAVLPGGGYSEKGGLDSTLLLQGNMLVEGGVSDANGNHDRVGIRAYAITLEERQLLRHEYEIRLARDVERAWHIDYMKNIATEKVGPNASVNPFDKEIFCRVYEIINLDLLFDIIDKVDDIREVKELPYGMHMRITCSEEDFTTPVSILSDVLADLVINGEEFVVMSRDYQAILDFDSILTRGINYPAVKMGEYEVNVLTAFRYLGGQYLRFEDLLLQDEGDSIFEDGMRFISTRYLVKDRDTVLKQINSLENIAYRFTDDYDVFYQLDGDGDEGKFLAEYMVGINWITLSTFGDRDMNQARKKFENKMYECLEFDGLEVRKEGIFDILTSDLKREYPDLEQFLKDIYLNKWFNSRLPTLHGMSPSEACQTEEGTRLLWAMFKRIKDKNRSKYLSGGPGYIQLNEYIRKLEQKKHKNI